jgi:hypothetical protein
MSCHPVPPDPDGAGSASLHITLTAAEQVLADTIETVNPGMPARELLGYAERLRAHLSALAAVCRGQDHQLSAVDDNQSGLRNNSA